MMIRNALPLVAVSFAALLSACAIPGGTPGGTHGGILGSSAARAASSNGASVLTASDSANLVGTADIGQRVNLPAGNPMGVPSAMVAREYFAASNRPCREIVASGVRVNSRIACLRSNGQWEWIRSISSSAVTSVSVPMAAALPVESEAAAVSKQEIKTAGFEEGATEGSDPLNWTPPAVIIPASANSALDDEGLPEQATVIDNETLWKFAQRTTGSGVHWQAIAEYNAIDDARDIQSGMTLFIPAHLAQER